MDGLEKVFIYKLCYDFLYLVCRIVRIYFCYLGRGRGGGFSLYYFIVIVQEIVNYIIVNYKLLFELYLMSYIFKLLQVFFFLVVLFGFSLGSVYQYVYQDLVIVDYIFKFQIFIFFNRRILSELKVFVEQLGVFLCLDILY